MTRRRRRKKEFLRMALGRAFVYLFFQARRGKKKGAEWSKREGISYLTRRRRRRKITTAPPPPPTTTTTSLPQKKKGRRNETKEKKREEGSRGRNENKHTDVLLLQHHPHSSSPSHYFVHSFLPSSPSPLLLPPLPPSLPPSLPPRHDRHIAIHFPPIPPAEGIIHMPPKLQPSHKPALVVLPFLPSIEDISLLGHLPVVRFLPPSLLLLLVLAAAAYFLPLRKEAAGEGGKLGEGFFLPGWEGGSMGGE